MPAVASPTSWSASWGGIVGGWLARQMGFDQAQGFIAAVVVAVFGALVIRLVLNSLSES